MDRQETAEAMELLSMLFQAFPASSDKTSPVTAKAYLTAIEGASIAAIREAVRKLIRGEVAEHNGRFVPSTAELSRAVRFEDFSIDMQRQHQARIAARKPDESKVVELSPEIRAKRLQQLKALGVRLRSMGEA